MPPHSKTPEDVVEKLFALFNDKKKFFFLFKREKKVFLRDLIHFSNSRWSAKRNAKKLRKFAQHKE
jgi:hypothetical protein